MDIYSYLKKDHRKVSALMKELLASRDPDQREDIFAEIREELTLHAKTEEATFYAALADEDETEEWIEEAKEEHGEMEDYMDRLSDMPAEGESWMELFGEFKHAVEHHVREEEQTIFEKARDILDDDEAEELAETMDRMKQKVMNQAA